MDEHYEASLFWANRGLYITFKTSKVFPSLATETLFLPYMIQKKILRSEINIERAAALELQKSRVGEMALESELQVKGCDLTQPGHKLLLSPLQAITVNLYLL